MTSNRSFCNTGALFKREFKQQAPLFLAAMVTGFLVFPIRMIPFLQSWMEERWTYQGGDDFLNTFRMELEMHLWSNGLSRVLILFLAIAAAISIFCYLHSRQQIDFYHALPISRGKLYAIKYTTGVLLVVPAYLMNFGLSCLLVCIYGYGSLLLDLIAYPMLMIVLAFLLIYTMSMLCMIVCGNTLVAVMAMIWGHLGTAILSFIGITMIELFYPTAVLGEGILKVMERLIPLIHIMGADGTFFSSFFGSNYEITTAESVDYMWFLAAAAACVLMILLGYVLSRMRQSESATTALAFPKLKAPLSVLMHTVLTCGIGVILSTSYQFSLLMFVIGAVIGALLAHCIVEIVYDLDFSGIKNGWKAFGVYAVAATVILTGIYLDITGFNTRIPERQQIVGVDLKSETDSRLSAEAFEKQKLNPIYGDEEIYSGTHEFAMLSSEENISTVLQIASAGVDSGIENDWKDDGYSTYTVEFALTNGSVFRRQYRISQEQREEIKILAERIRTSREYNEERRAIHLVDPEQVSMLSTESLMSNTSSNPETSTTVSMYDWDFVHYTEDKQQIQQIFAALEEEYELLTPQYARLHQPVLLIHTMDADIAHKLEQRYPRDCMDYILSALSNGYLYRNMQVIPVYSNFTKTLERLETYFGEINYTYPPEDISEIQLFWYEDVQKDSIDSVQEHEEIITDRGEIEILLKYATLSNMIAFCEVAPEIHPRCSIQFQYGQESIYLDLLDTDAVNHILQKYQQ